ncbi:hypothetical protein GUI12_04390 [Anaplasmataceae bacterium AB001_6]|nr:hypothetical protein GUI12_04390 [Anaplasmataceae bacterium AB001_6]
MHFNEFNNDTEDDSKDPKDVYCEVYKKKLSELYYSLVVGEKKDMLIGSEGDITFFEIRLVAKKFIWDSELKNFRKIVANPRNKRSRENNVDAKKDVFIPSETTDNISIDSDLKEEEFVD